ARYRSEWESTDLQYRQALADVALEAARDYYGVLKAESDLRSRQRALTGALSYQALVHSKIDAGRAKPADAEAVEIQVAQAQSGVVAAHGALKLAGFALNRELGRPLDEPISIKAEGEPQPSMESLTDDLALARRNRPELQRLEASLRAAIAAESLVRTENQPSLSVRGQVTEQTPSAFTAEHYYGASLQLEIPILGSGKFRDDKAEAAARSEQVRSELANARSEIDLAVAAARQQVKDAGRSLQLAELQRRAAADTLVVAEKAYEVGKGTVLDVQAARREAADAGDRASLAEYDLQMAAVQLRYSLGELVSDSTQTENGA
ncbi:MAG TPA: TolC family protein, partial [Chthonomonadales bacterium]|nr:TolC family protein [Chthonomonadales bacterium]